MLSGNSFDAAFMKTCVIGPEFHDCYLSNPDDPALGITDRHMLIMCGAGPACYPGAA